MVALQGIGCASHNGASIADQGGEREPCYGNGTCNAGLSCLSGLCVHLTDAAGTPVKGDAASNMVQADAATGPLADAATSPDADHVDVPLGAYREVSLLGLGVPATWFTVNDCYADPGNCTTGGNEADRAFDGAPFCTKGTTAKTDLKNWGSSAVLSFDADYDATTAGIVGISFDLTGVSPAEVEVSFQSVVPDPDLAVGEAGTRPLGQHGTVLFSSLTTPNYAFPFDPTKISMMGVNVPAHVTPTPFDYCIANVAFLAPR